MKPGFLFSVVAIVAIIVAASFGLHIMPLTPVRALSPENASIALWVCPAASQAFDAIAIGMQHFRNGLLIVFFFALIFTILSFLWALYQDLIKDEFNQDRYEFPVYLLKCLFWLTIVALILMRGPNYYKTVGVQGAPGAYVLCENYDKNALPVRKDAVVLRSKINP